MNIPDFIYEKKTQKPTKKTNKPSHTRTSQFLITINPNLGTKNLNNEIVKQIYINLENAQTKLKENIKEYVKPLPGKKNFIPPDLIKFEAQHERGEQIGKLHTHIFIQFDALCYMNVDKLKELYDNEFAITNPIERYNELKKAGKNPIRVECKYIKDGLTTSLNYIFKNNETNKQEYKGNIDNYQQDQQQEIKQQQTQQQDKIITNDQIPKTKSNHNISDEDKYELSSYLDGFNLNNRGFPLPKIFRKTY
jgi:hypothetical protein